MIIEMKGFASFCSGLESFQCQKGRRDLKKKFDKNKSLLKKPPKKKI